MARDKTPYGAYEEKNGRTCFARIISVNEKTRTCRVKTLGIGKGPAGTDDLDQQEVQFISMANHQDGDEDTYIPRPGQYGVVIFINAEPYLFGYYQPPLASGSEELAKRVPLSPGDRIIKMVAGNRIILRAGGTVEIESTKLCRTYWLPSQNLINSVCQNYELETDGGSMYWKRNNDDGTTNLQFFAFNNVTPTKAIDFQIGTNDDDGASIITMSMGDYTPEDDDITKRLFDLRVAPTGDTKLNLGPDKMTLKIIAATGDIEMITEGNVKQVIKGNVDQDVTGNVTEIIKGNASQTVDGNIDVTTKQNATVTTKGDATIKSAANVTISSDANMATAAKGNSTADAKGNMIIKSQQNAQFSGVAQTVVGSGGSPTVVNGSVVLLGGGGLPVARVGDTSIGVGNQGRPVVSTIVRGSTKVLAS